MNAFARLGIVLGLLPLSFLVVHTLAAESCAPIPSGLVNWWPADGNSEDVRRYEDASPHGGVGYAPGKIGQAFSLDGIDDYFSLPSSRRVVGQSFFSIACWVKQPAGAESGIIYSELHGTSVILHFGLTSEGLIYLAFRTDLIAEASTPTVFTSVGSITAEEWHFIVATVDVAAKSYNMYIDGVPTAISGSDHTTREYFVTAADWSCIGVYRGSTLAGWFSGEIDELQMYYRVLSPSDVASIYAAGSQGVCHPPWPPEVPGFSVEIFADVTDPVHMTFGEQGDMYVGRENSGSGGGTADAVSIHRVLAGGIVEEYGPPIADPDAVLFDRLGRVSQPGAVLVAGGIPNSNPSLGAVRAILPDLAVVIAIGPSTVFPNSNDIIFDHQGRLLILDEATHRVIVYTGGQLSVLFDLPSGFPEFIAVDEQDRVFTSELSSDRSHSTIRVHDSQGNLINGALVHGLAGYPIACGPGGDEWGADAYTINEDGALVRVTADGNITYLGGIFPVWAYLAFGPDSALYISHFSGDCILRVKPLEAPGTIAGSVTEASNPLGGVTVDLSDTAGLLGSLTTDPATGTFDFGELDPGDYVVDLILPLGYAGMGSCDLSVLVSLDPGETELVNFQLEQVMVTAEARGLGYWKHQYNVYESNKGHAQESQADLQTYQQNIYDHFYARADEYAIQIDEVTHSNGGTLSDADAFGTLSARGSIGTTLKAYSQFLALLLNVVSGKIGQYHEVTADGMTVSQAITYIADLLKDADMSNDELARDIAEQVNENHQIAAGTIPTSTLYIAYEQANRLSGGVHLDVRPNPSAEAFEILYSVPSGDSKILLEVYDLSGRLVRRLVNGSQGAGSHRVIWQGDDENGDAVADGVYFYRLETNGETQTLKAVIIRQ